MTGEQFTMPAVDAESDRVRRHEEIWGPEGDDEIRKLIADLAYEKFRKQAERQGNA